MKKLRWPLLIALVAVAAIVILLLNQQAPLLQPQPVEPVIEPAEGGVYAEGLVGSLGRLNPILDDYNPVDRDVDRLIFSGLVRFDDRGLPQADLADSWGVTKDGTVYNFSLRATAVWHDGQPVTSDDVIFTVNLLKDENSPISDDLREFWNQVEVEKLDERSVSFRLAESFAPFLDYLTFGILPSHLLGDLSFSDLQEASFNLKPIGSGPYRFDHLIVENGKITGVVLAAFGEYYAQKPFIQQVAFRYYPDARAALAAYQKGEILGLNRVSADILPDVLRESKLNLYTGRLSQLSLVLFNLGDAQLPFFQDLAVRKALMMGVNRQWMIDRIMGGQAILADGPIFPGTWASYEGLPRLEYDVDAATALLRDAGYTIPAAGGVVREKEGVPLVFELLYLDDEQHAAIAEALRDDWSKLGVMANLRAVGYDELVGEALEQRTYQAALVDLNLSQSPDPDPYTFWHQAQITGGQNYSKWDDRQASEYLEQARITLDLAERQRLYRNFQVRFSQELPAFMLFYPVYAYAVDSSVQGVRMGPLYAPDNRFDTVTNWFLLAKRANAPLSTPQIILATPTP